MAKILLLNLPVMVNTYRTVMPPLGLQYIAANIDKKHTVGIFDQALNYDFKQDMNNGSWIYGTSKSAFLQLIGDFKPDVIGISCNYSYQHSFLRTTLEALKEHFPSIKLVIGGNHVTAYYQKNLPPLDCDAAILGEGEEAFNQYLNGAFEPGKFYQVKDLDSLNFPARGDMQPYFDLNLQHHGINTPGGRTMVMLTSRGCYRNCIFCSVRNIWGKGVRMRSPENVLAEVDELINKYNATEIHFEDDNLLYDKQRILKIFNGLGKYHIQWTCPNGVDLSKIDREVLHAMRDNGCKRITICPESTSDNVLKFYRKPFNFKMIEEKVKLIREFDFELVGYFIVGAPDETLQEAWNTVKFAVNEFDDHSISCLAPYLGTNLYDYCEKHNLFPYDHVKENFINMQADVVSGFKRKMTDSNMVQIIQMAGLAKGSIKL